MLLDLNSYEKEERLGCQRDSVKQISGKMEEIKGAQSEFVKEPAAEWTGIVEGY